MLVPRGLGTYKGASKAEQVAHAQTIGHPAIEGCADVAPDLLCCLEFERDNPPEDIDEFREELLRKWASVKVTRADRDKALRSTLSSEFQKSLKITMCSYAFFSVFGCLGRDLVAVLGRLGRS